jgi:hypothetical protein
LSSRSSRQQNEHLITAIAVPVVVVQGGIFEASLNHDDLHVIEVSSGLTLWRGPHDLHWYAVDIVTRSALQEFNNRAHATAVKFEDLINNAPWHQSTTSAWSIRLYSQIATLTQPDLLRRATWVVAWDTVESYAERPFPTG